MRTIAITLLLIVALTGTVRAQEPILIDHDSVARFDQMTAEQFTTLREDFRIYYGHTSHGSQLVTGLAMLRAEDEELFALPALVEPGGDLGHNGDLTWATTTRNWLDGHPETNLVMWSWCGGCSDNTDAGIDAYLQAMTQLEMEYPGRTFIYMTGHLDGSGPSGLLYHNNNRIRDYCALHGKVLFDFADIESWDPDGNYYPEESDGCNWCYDWCAENSCPGCESCAHSHCFNCYRKGRALWWMLHEVAGMSVAAARDEVPGPAVALGPNYPNPFNPSTRVAVSVSEPCRGSLAVYDLQGRTVAVLHRGDFAAGEHVFNWTPGSGGQPGAASCVYLCRLQTGNQVQEIKMTLLK